MSSPLRIGFVPEHFSTPLHFAQKHFGLEATLIPFPSGTVINNVEQYLAAGGEYYTCDPKVKAEACLPLFNAQQQCIGIVDGEAFNTDFFDKATLALLIACCIKIPHFLV